MFESPLASFPLEDSFVSKTKIKEERRIASLDLLSSGQLMLQSSVTRVRSSPRHESIPSLVNISPSSRRHQSIPSLVAECVLSEYQTKKKRSRNVVNTQLRLVIFSFLSSSQMPVVFYHTVEFR